MAQTYTIKDCSSKYQGSLFQAELKVIYLRMKNEPINNSPWRYCLSRAQVTDVLSFTPLCCYQDFY